MREGGLSQALLLADATGRYPGYATFILITQRLFSSDFLDSLMYLRFFFINATLFSMILFFRQMKVGLTNSILFSLAIFLVPTASQSINLNTQDSAKCFALILGIVATLNLLEKVRNNESKKAPFLLLIFSSIILGSTRAPEILPFYAFVGTFIFLTTEFTSAQKWKHFCFIAAPSFIFLVALHVYGRIIVKTWAVSSHGRPPDIWLNLARRHVQSVEHVYQKLFQFLYLCLANFLNKTSYFFDDYLFKRGSFSMLDVSSFFPGLQRVSDYRTYILYPLSICVCLFLLTSLFIWRSDKFLRSTIAGVFASAGFYIYGLNHYETRYWLIVFILLAIIVFHLVSKLRYRYFAQIATISLIVFESYLAYESFYDLTSWDKSTMAQASLWKKDMQANCEGSVISKIILPVEYFDWSSYRYFASPICPRITVERMNKPQESTLDPNILLLDSKYFHEVELRAAASPL